MAKDDARLQVVLEAKIDKLTERLNAANSAVFKASYKMQRDIDATARRVSQSFERDMASSVGRAEKQIVRSSVGISNAIKGMAASLAAGITAREIASLADGYTRFTNQLKVAGIEGSGLAQVQENLFGIAQKYGVELESVGTLYGRLSQTSKELGASQADLLRFTNGVAAALKVQGGSADSTKGALLQLSQALGGEIVRAEEFNSINEGARPILQAVANGIDRFGGSVAKLRGEVIEGHVTSQEFFQGFLKGSGDLATQATQANLTIGASFTVLSNALAKYVGETDASLSATQRFSTAIYGIADNLDTIVPALTVLATLIGTRYVVAAAASATATIADTAAKVADGLATEALAAANLRLVASGGAATASMAAARAGVTGLAVAQGVAARGFVAFAALLGGPVGLAIITFTAGIAFLIARSTEAAQQARAMEKAHRDLDPVLATVKDNLEKAANASGHVRDGYLAAADAAYALSDASLDSARKVIAAERAKIAALEAARKQRANSGKNTPSADFLANADEAGAQGRLDRAQQELKAAEDVLISAGLGRRRGSRGHGTTFERITPSEAARVGSTAGAGPAGETSAQKKARLKAEKDATAAANRAEADRLAALRADKSFDADLRRAQTDYLEAQVEGSNDAKERLRLETERLEFARDQRNREIAKEGPTAQGGSGKYTADEVAQLQDLQRKTTDQDIANLQARDKDRIAKEALDASQADLDIQAEIARLDAALATTASQRRDAELRLLDLADKREAAELEAIIASKASTAAEVAIAQKRLDALNNTAGARREGVMRDTAGPLQQYIQDTPRTVDETNEAMQRLAVEGLDSLNSGLAQAATGARELGDVAKDVFMQMVNDLLSAAIRKNITAPLGELITSYVPGFNAGGNDSFGGGVTRINEAGPEGVAFLPKNTKIIPNSVLRSLAAQNQRPLRSGLRAPFAYSPTIRVDGYSGDPFELREQLGGLLQAERRSLLTMLPSYLARYDRERN